MDWLSRERNEQLRYAAVLILRQMAANAPAVFNVFVRQFIDVIWAGLRDSKLLVREAATDALRVCASQTFQSSVHHYCVFPFLTGPARLQGKP